MDQETTDFFQPVLESINAELAGLRTNLAGVRAEMADKHAIRELSTSMLHYSSHVEMLLSEFAASQRYFSADLADLKRVAALEQRMPPAPEAAA